MMKHIHNKFSVLRLSGLIMAVVLLMVVALPASAGVAVIMAADSGVNTLPKGDVRAIFLIKRSNLPNGQTAHPVDQAKSSATYQAFIQSVLGKTDRQLKNYWSRLVFSGKGAPLSALASDQAVKDYVMSTEGGIGYIDSAAVDSSVKVVFSTP